MFTSAAKIACQLDKKPWTLDKNLKTVGSETDCENWCATFGRFQRKLYRRMSKKYRPLIELRKTEHVLVGWYYVVND